MKHLKEHTAYYLLTLGNNRMSLFVVQFLEKIGLTMLKHEKQNTNNIKQNNFFNKFLLLRVKPFNKLKKNNLKEAFIWNRLLYK